MEDLSRFSNGPTKRRLGARGDDVRDVEATSPDLLAASRVWQSCNGLADATVSHRRWAHGEQEGTR